MQNSREFYRELAIKRGYGFKLKKMKTITLDPLKRFKFSADACLPGLMKGREGGCLANSSIWRVACPLESGLITLKMSLKYIKSNASCIFQSISLKWKSFTQLLLADQGAGKVL